MESGDPGRKTDERSRRTRPGGRRAAPPPMSSLRYPLSWPHSAGLRLTFCLLLSSDYERRFKPAMQKMTAGTPAVRFRTYGRHKTGKFGVEGSASGARSAHAGGSTLGNLGAVPTFWAAGSSFVGRWSGHKGGRAKAQLGFRDPHRLARGRSHGVDAPGQQRPATAQKAVSTRLLVRACVNQAEWVARRRRRWGAAAGGSAMPSLRQPSVAGSVTKRNGGRT
jgi:hypothetical protein